VAPEKQTAGVTLHDEGGSFSTGLDLVPTTMAIAKLRRTMFSSVGAGETTPAACIVRFYCWRSSHER
jgi:hypothetical protein